MNLNHFIFIYIIVLLSIIINISYTNEYKYNFYDLIHLSKRHSNDYYLEQCAKVYFIMGQLGIVNVLIFLDDTWPFSYKQAIMLKELKDRLEHSGVPKTLFFAIIKDSTSSIINNDSLIDTNNNDNTEKEAWSGVSPEELIEISSNSFNLTKKSLIKIISSDIFVIEDNNKLNIWRELKGTRDQIIIIDRCGKLTYHIIIPWSILHFPYVKAGILSTHNDDPCDSCDTYVTVYNFDEKSHDISNIYDQEDNINDITTSMTFNNIENESIQSSSAGITTESIETITDINSYTDEIDRENNMVFPDIRIIMRAPHYHIDDDSTKKHEYLVLKLNDTNFHGHLNGTSVHHSYVSTVNKSTDESMMSGIVFEKDESPGFYGEVADYWRDINNDYKFEEQPIENNEDFDVKIVNDNEMDISTIQSNDETVTENIDNVSSIDNEEIEAHNKLLAHYSRLLPWLYYVLDK